MESTDEVAKVDVETTVANSAVPAVSTTINDVVVKTEFNAEESCHDKRKRK